MDEQIKKRYTYWCDNVKDNHCLTLLDQMKDDPTQIENAFFKELAFGTGGLRGELGVGSNRMNIYTVGKATQGIAQYMLTHLPRQLHKVAISYDSRLQSDEFAQIVANILSANGITVYLYDRLMPTPCLSFATRYYHCGIGIMITASHNPKQYNGYKVYGHDGCQITDDAADLIYGCIQQIDPFTQVKGLNVNEVNSDLIYPIGEKVDQAYLVNVLAQDPTNGKEALDKNVKIIYTPLNGTGRVPVLNALTAYGFSAIEVVKAQEMPDGTFKTCPYPNPEIKEAMQLGLEKAKASHADLLLATDPDCDRVGIAVKNSSDAIKNGEDEYVLLSGNEVGLLLLDFIAKMRSKHNTMPNNPVFVKTIVTMDLAKRIADKYSIETRNVLTGFKYIGEQIGLLESQGRSEDFILGFEESYGYLAGSYVRDKDAVVGSLLICILFAYYSYHHINLVDQLNAIYDEYGYCYNTLHSYQFPGASGFTQMQSIMASIRQNKPLFDGFNVTEVLDYQLGIDSLPKSNVIKFVFDNGSVVLRPSGTEPKLKAYLSIIAKDKKEAQLAEAKLHKIVDEFMKP